MTMPAQPTEWTVDMVRALPDDGNRYEVLPFVGGEPVHAWTELGHLLLAIEVLSPSTAVTDRGPKRALHQDRRRAFPSTGSSTPPNA
jgi:hypothetical protein